MARWMSGLGGERIFLSRNAGPVAALLAVAEVILLVVPANYRIRLAALLLMAPVLLPSRLSPGVVEQGLWTGVD